jgi:hypothetical protein
MEVHRRDKLRGEREEISTVGNEKIRKSTDMILPAQKWKRGAGTRKEKI